MSDQLRFDLADAPADQVRPVDHRAASPEDAPTPAPPEGLVVTVIADSTGVDKRFDYVVPPEWVDRVEVGTRVRISLANRRLAAWVVGVDTVPESGVSLRPIAKVTGHGPPPSVLDLASWARWRWAAKNDVPFLRAGSPLKATAALPRPGRRSHPVPTVSDPVVTRAFAAADRDGLAVLRLPPATDPSPVALAAAARGDALVVCAGRRQATSVATALRRAGVPVAVLPDGWAQARAGGHVVVGTRVAAWAPIADLAAVVVIDEHDELLQEESSPTWHARDVAVERARRAGVPCVLVSPAPTLEALALVEEPVRPDRAAERDGWPIVDVVDRRDEDTARQALFSPQFATAVRSGGRIVAILNQKGRAPLLACASCRAVAECATCGSSVQRHTDDAVLRCRRCEAERPVVCQACGSVQLKAIRMGVSRVRDDLEALAGEPVVEVTADTPVRDIDDARLLIGTEALLHQAQRADVVAFLDFDQELFAARYRAADQAMTLLIRAGRLVGGRHGGGRVMIQTRAPQHEVIRAALIGDPGRLAATESAARVVFGYPPHGALAEIGDQAAAAFVERLDARSIPGVEVIGPSDNRWRVLAPDHRTLCDALASVDRPPGRLRLAVDPPRV